MTVTYECDFDGARHSAGFVRCVVVRALYVNRSANDSARDDGAREMVIARARQYDDWRCSMMMIRRAMSDVTVSGGGGQRQITVRLRW